MRSPASWLAKGLKGWVGILADCLNEGFTLSDEDKKEITERIRQIEALLNG